MHLVCEGGIVAFQGEGNNVQTLAWLFGTRAVAHTAVCSNVRMPIWLSYQLKFKVHLRVYPFKELCLKGVAFDRAKGD